MGALFHGDRRLRAGPRGYPRRLLRWHQTTNPAISRPCSRRRRTPPSSWSTWRTPPSSSATRAWPTRSHELEERLDGPRPRDARGVRARRALAARRRGDVERAARALGDRAHGQRRRRHRPHRHPPARHPRRAGRRPRRRGGDLAPRARARRTPLLAHRSLADVEPADRGRDARRGHPARQGLDHRPRRRRDAAARRRADPPRPARTASPSCACSPARPSGARPAPTTIPPIPTDLDRAVDVLVEMKNVSEVAIGLAYSALLFNDQGLAAEVSHLEDRLDEMRERLEVWVLRSASEQVDPSPLRGLLHLGARGRGARRRRPADGVAGRGGRGDAPDPRHRASATPTR